MNHKIISKIKQLLFFATEFWDNYYTATTIKTQNSETGDEASAGDMEDSSFGSLLVHKQNSSIAQGI